MRTTPGLDQCRALPGINTVTWRRGPDILPTAGCTNRTVRLEVRMLNPYGVFGRRFEIEDSCCRQARF
jgi:hypothetical protein